MAAVTAVIRVAAAAAMLLRCGLGLRGLGCRARRLGLGAGG
ncbi:MAG: hypothetical protein JWL96_1587, partial [Sphingomonas bacterium]|nr:hypothetical protein [Sphingomonas bacterium]